MPKMNSPMLSIKADMFDMLVKRLREALKAGNDTVVRSILREMNVQTIQARDYLPETSPTVDGYLENPVEHDAHYATNS